jgi:hypothetical protein
MNMLYESVKKRGSTIIVPSSVVDSMNLGGVGGMTSLAKSEEKTPSAGSGSSAASPALQGAENTGM